MSTDPRTIDAAVQRLMFWGVRHCSARVTRANMVVSTGESWIGREACWEFATHATVRKGRVSPRCAAHAVEDAERMGVTINEHPMIELKANEKPRRPAKPQKPDPRNPLNEIACLTHAAARLLRDS